MNVLEKLERERKNSLYLLYSAIASFIVSIILIIIFLFTSNNILLICLILFLLLSLGLFFYSLGLFEKVQKGFKDYVLSEIRKDILPNAKLIENQGVPLDEIYKSGLLKVADKSKTKNLMTGSLNNINFKTSNLFLEERVLHTSKNGSRNVSYVKYFDGKVLIFDFHKNFKNSLIITKNSNISDNFQMKKLQESDSKYYLYSDNLDFANNVLSEGIKNAFYELDHINKDSLMISIRGSKLYIAINNVSSKLDKVKLNEHITKDSLEYIRKRMEIITYILLELKNGDVFL